MLMANKKSKGSSTRKKGRLQPNVPRAGFRGDGVRYGCGGKKH